MDEYDDVNVKCLKEYFRKFILPCISWSIMVKSKMRMAGVTFSEKLWVLELTDHINRYGEWIK